MKDMDRYHCPTDRVCPESGSVMTVLLAAVAMVAVMGVTTFNILSGPVTTMSKTTYKSMAQNQIDATVGTIMRLSSTDCDGDTYMEPPEARVDGTDYKLPNNLGVPTTDPWNTDYMYCPFDTGTVDDPACGGATQARYAGTTDPTTGDDEANYVFAVISAGPDKIFQTTCSDYVDTTTPVVVPAGDDVASSYTHETARAAAPSIWSLKSGDPDTATIDKDIELGSDINIDEIRGVGSFGDITASNLTDATGGLQPGDEFQVTQCTLTDKGLMRYNSGGLRVIQYTTTAEQDISASSSVQLSLPSPPTPGNAIVVIASGDIESSSGGAMITFPDGSVTDNEGNTYTKAVETVGLKESPAYDGTMALHVAENISASGGTFTVDVDPVNIVSTGANRDVNVAVLEVGNLATANIIDTVGSIVKSEEGGTFPTGISTTVSTTNDISQDNTFIISFITQVGAEQPMQILAEDGSNLVYNLGNNGVSRRFVAAYKVQEDAGPASFTWKHNNVTSGYYSGIGFGIVALKGDGTVPSPPSIEVCDGSNWIPVVQDSGSGGGSTGTNDYWINGTSYLHYSNGEVMTTTLEDLPKHSANYIFKSVTDNNFGVMAQNASSPSDHAYISMFRARGTSGSPTDVVDGDVLGGFNFQGAFNGSLYTTGQIKAEVDGTVSASVIPSRLRLHASDSTGSPTRTVVFDGDGRLGIGTDNPQYSIHTKTGDNQSSEFRLSTYNNDGPAILELRRAKSGTATEAGDEVGALEFFGYGNAGYKKLAAIRATTTGPATASSVQGQLAFLNSNDGDDIGAAYDNNEDANLRFLTTGEVGINIDKLSNLVQDTQINGSLHITDECTENTSIAVVQTMPQQSAINVSGDSAAMPSIPTAGNTIVVPLAMTRSGWLWDARAEIITDNHGNSYSRRAGPPQGDTRVFIYVSENIQIDPNETDFTLTFSSGYSDNRLEWGALEIAGGGANNIHGTTYANGLFSEHDSYNGSAGNLTMNDPDTISSPGIAIAAMSLISTTHSNSNIDLTTSGWDENIYASNNSQTTVGFNVATRIYQDADVPTMMSASFNFTPTSGTDPGVSGYMIHFRQDKNAATCDENQEVIDIPMPAGGYMFFHPDKATFIAGYESAPWTLHQDNYSPGSFYFGENFNLSGTYPDQIVIGNNSSTCCRSITLGSYSYSNDNGVTIVANNASSSGGRKTMISGKNNHADGYEAYALGGESNVILGSYSTAWGSGMNITGSYTLGVSLGNEQHLAGSTNTSGGWRNLYSHRIYFQKFTASQTGTAQSIYISTFDGNGNAIKAGIYDASRNLLARGEITEMSNNSTHTVTIPLDTPASITSGQDYYIAILPDGSSYVNVKVNPGMTVDTGTYNTSYAGGLIDPLPVVTETSEDAYPIGITTGVEYSTADNAFIVGSGKVSIGATSSTETFEVTGTQGLTGSTTWTNTSDARLKDIHGAYTKGLNEILNLHPVTFSYKKDNPLGRPSDTVIQGLIAQEVQPHFPEAVTTREDGYLDLNMHSINVAMINAVKELGSTSKQMETANTALQNSAATLDDNIKTLEHDLTRLEKITSDKRAGLYGLLPVAALLIIGGLYVGRRLKNNSGSEVSK